MKISLKPNEIGFTVFFKNDPKIEEFFKETSLNQMSSYIGYNCFQIPNLLNYPHKYRLCLVNHEGFYYSDHPVIAMITLKGSSVKEYSFSFRGLINAEKYINDFSNMVNDFVKDVIKPYYMTKRFIENKESKLINNDVVNKEGYSKNWYSYYRNYKKYIHEYSEGLLAK